MVVVRRRGLVLLLILPLAAAIVVGLGAFQLAQSRGFAEWVLFGVICFVLVWVAVAVWALRGATVVSRALRRVRESHDHSRTMLEFQLRRLGAFGRELVETVDDTLELSEMRSRKLAASSALIRFLMRNSDLPFVVADPTGTVVFATKKALDKAPGSLTIGASLSESLEDFSFRGLLSEARETRAAVKRSSGSTALYAYPVFDELREISFVVISIGGAAPAEGVPQVPVAAGGPAPNAKGGLANMVGGIGRWWSKRAPAKTSPSEE